MRKLFFAVFVFGLSSVCWAQTSSGAWENLSALHAGQKIQVIDKNNGRHSGAFLSVDHLGIKLHENSGDTSVQRENVARVTVSGHRLEHIVLGLGIGAGTGAVIGAAGGGCAAGNDCIGLTRGQTAGLAAATGGAIGAILGAVLPGHKTIYRAP